MPNITCIMQWNIYSLYSASDRGSAAHREFGVWHACLGGGCQDLCAPKDSRREAGEDSCSDPAASLPAASGSDVSGWGSRAAGDASSICVAGSDRRFDHRDFSLLSNSDDGSGFRFREGFALDFQYFRNAGFDHSHRLGDRLPGLRLHGGGLLDPRVLGSEPIGDSLRRLLHLG
jgi:hypothetical protein